MTKTFQLVLVVQELRKPSKPVRSGWAEASKKLAAANDDALVLGEFSNADDADLTW